MIIYTRLGLWMNKSNILSNYMPSTFLLFSSHLYTTEKYLSPYDPFKKRRFRGIKKLVPCHVWSRMLPGSQCSLFSYPKCHSLTNLFMPKTHLPGALLGTKTIRTNTTLRNFKSNGKENQNITNKGTQFKGLWQIWSLIILVELKWTVLL